MPSLQVEIDVLKRLHQRIKNQLGFRAGVDAETVGNWLEELVATLIEERESRERREGAD
jgi:hypothetical protein